MDRLLELAGCSGALRSIAMCIRRLSDYGLKHGYDFDLDEVEDLAVSCGRVADKLHEIAGRAF